jgi:hypothetical protein
MKTYDVTFNHKGLERVHADYVEVGDKYISFFKKQTAHMKIWRANIKDIKVIKDDAT